MDAWTACFFLNRRADLPLGLTMAMLAAEHADAMRGEFGEPVDVLGLSTGGSIAQQLAADHPDVVRRLVLISTGCRLRPVARLAQRRVAARIRAGAARQALAVMAAELVPPWRGRYIAAVVASALGPRWFPAEDLRDMAITIDAEDSFDLAECPAIASPTLLIAGGRDRFYDLAILEETAALIPGCRLSLHPDAGTSPSPAARAPSPKPSVPERIDDVVLLSIRARRRRRAALTRSRNTNAQRTLASSVSGSGGLSALDIRGRSPDPLDEVVELVARGRIDIGEDDRVVDRASGRDHDLVALVAHAGDHPHVNTIPQFGWRDRIARAPDRRSRQRCCSERYRWAVRPPRLEAA